MNLAGIVARIADMLSRDDLAPQIKAEVQAAIRRYEREFWYFTETRGAAITLSPGVQWYQTITVATDGSAWALTPLASFTMPAEQIISIDYARLSPVAGGLTRDMTQVPYREFERWREGSSAAGQPTAFTLYAGQIGIWPIPVFADGFQMSCTIKPVMPERDVDESVFFDEAQELIESCAAANVYEKFLRDYDAAAGHRQREMVQIAALRAEGARKKGTRRLRVNY